MQWGVNPGCMISGDQFVCVFCILKSEYWHKKVTFFICFPPWTHNLPNWSSSASAPKMPWMMLCILGKCCSLVHLLKRQRWCPIFYSLFFSCLWGHWEPTNGFYLIVLSENFCPPQISWLTNPSTAFWIFLDIFWKLIYLQVHSWNTIWFHQACQDKWQILSPHCCIAYSIGSPKKLRFGQYWYILLLIDPSSFSNILPADEIPLLSNCMSQARSWSWRSSMNPRARLCYLYRNTWVGFLSKMREEREW